MGSAKVAITMEKDLLKQVDRWVTEGRYPNRSQAIQAAVPLWGPSGGHRELILERAPPAPSRALVCQADCRGGACVSREPFRVRVFRDETAGLSRRWPGDRETLAEEEAIGPAPR